MAWSGLLLTSATVMLALRSLSALSHAAAAQDGDEVLLALAREGQGAMLTGATFPYCRYKDWLTPTSTLPDSQVVSAEGRRQFWEWKSRHREEQRQMPVWNSQPKWEVRGVLLLTNAP